MVDSAGGGRVVRTPLVEFIAVCVVVAGLELITWVVSRQDRPVTDYAVAVYVGMAWIVVSVTAYRVLAFYWR